MIESNRTCKDEMAGLDEKLEIFKGRETESIDKDNAKNKEGNFIGSDSNCYANVTNKSRTRSEFSNKQI